MCRSPSVRHLTAAYRAAVRKSARLTCAGVTRNSRFATPAGMSPRDSTAEALSRTRIIERAILRPPVEGLAGLSLGGFVDGLGINKAGAIGPFASKPELQLASLERTIRRCESRPGIRSRRRPSAAIGCSWRASNGSRTSNAVCGPVARSRITTPREVELRVGALANRNPAEAERRQDLAQHTVRQRWQFDEQMTTLRAGGELLTTARKDR